jgi:hypothetical protein
MERRLSDAPAVAEALTGAEKGALPDWVQDSQRACKWRASVNSEQPQDTVCYCAGSARGGLVARGVSSGTERLTIVAQNVCSCAEDLQARNTLEPGWTRQEGRVAGPAAQPPVHGQAVHQLDAVSTHRLGRPEGVWRRGGSGGVTHKLHDATRQQAEEAMTRRLGSTPAERMASSARVLQSEKKDAQEEAGGACPVPGRRTSASGTSQAGSQPLSSKSAGGIQEEW